LNRYDCQSLATKVINHNKVSDVLKLCGIETNNQEKRNNHFKPRNEAVSSLLLFDQNTKDLRRRFYQLTVLSALSIENNGIGRDNLINKISCEYNMDDTQSRQISSSIDSLLQLRKITSRDSLLYISDSERQHFKGLRDASQLERDKLESEFGSKVDELIGGTDEEAKELLLDNFLYLTEYLIGVNYDTYNLTDTDNEYYSNIKESISLRVGQDKAVNVFKELVDFFSKSSFVKHIACAKLYDAFLNIKSSNLINALGGKESLNVYIDSSVFIPMICGVLFETVCNRFSLSGASLHKLISSHRFNAIVPYDYMEEVAGHLIEACRDYKYIIEQDIDLSSSGNAFVSHFSEYRKSNSSFSFEKYMDVFGIKVSTIKADITDDQFFKIRDRAINQLEKLAAYYDFNVKKMSVDFLEAKVTELKIFAQENRFQRPDILIQHDARVIGFLTSGNVEAGVVKLLCTWDKLHSIRNPDGADGYYVMHPVALIDYLSLAKGDGDIPVSHLRDFALMQGEKDLELSGKIWDTIARIENDNLCDASLIQKAKIFKEQYMLEHANDENIADAQVEKEWKAWRK